MNLTSGNLRNLLLMDETGEMVYSRDLLVNSDNELWIGAESGKFKAYIGASSADIRGTVPFELK